MRVDASYKHTVLFDQSEAFFFVSLIWMKKAMDLTRGSLSCPSQDTFVSTTSCKIVHDLRSLREIAQAYVLKTGRWKDILGCDTATSREDVQRDSFAEQEMPGFASDSCDMLDGLESLAFLHVPYDARVKVECSSIKCFIHIIRDGAKLMFCLLATQVIEHFIEEGNSSKDGWGLSFAKKESFTFGFADDEPAVVKGWRVLIKPCYDLRLPVWREQMRKIWHGSDTPSDSLTT
jgi:hypothetical protein